MAIDSSIYSLVDSRGLLQGLAGIGEAYQQGVEVKNRLAQLAEQSDINRLNKQKLQYEIDQLPALQAEKKRQQNEKIMQGISREIAQNPEGIDSILERHSANADKLGVDPTHITWLAYDLKNSPDIETMRDRAMYHANPAEYEKQMFEAKFRKGEKVSDLNKLIQERDKLKLTNPNSPDLSIYDQAIEKSSTHAPTIQFMPSGDGSIKAISASRGKKGSVTVTDTGISEKPKSMTADQEAKFRESWSKDYAELTGAMQTARDIAESAGKVKNAPGLSGITGVSGYMPSVPGSAASSAMADFETLKGKVTAMGKALMAASGSIGTMANQEWKIVSDAVAAIDPTKMSPEKLKEQIGLIEQQANGLMTRMSDKYERQYGKYYNDFPEFRIDKQKTAQPTTAQPYSDAEKERRYQEWKAKQGK